MRDKEDTQAPKTPEQKEELKKLKKDAFQKKKREFLSKLEGGKYETK